MAARAPGGTRCVSTRHGRPCKAWAIRGTTVCRAHGGANVVTRRKGAVRADVLDWGLGDVLEDPAVVLLRVITVTSQRQALYAELLRQSYEAHQVLGEEGQFQLPSGIGALIGHKLAPTAHGDMMPVEEAIRGLVVLEGQERDRAVKYAATAINAHLAERQVRVAERTGEAIIKAISLALDAAGLTGAARTTAQNAAADYLLTLEG